MTLTHRLTFARDGPKVIAVTDSTKLPYTFEPGMGVIMLHNKRTGIVSLVDDTDGSFDVSGFGWFTAEVLIADIDHPGTRGLLLAQYREASGLPVANAAWSEFRDEWIVVGCPLDPEPFPPVGRGESEGAAILDALTRLAASKAAAEVETGSDEDYRQRINTLAGRINVLDAKLARMDATLANIADRMANLDGMGAP